MVKKVLSLLHSGEKDMVESSQVMDGHRTLIRYYAIRNAAGDYLGVLQITEDVEHICQLGEQHTFEHGIVEGQVVDEATTASIMDHQNDDKDSSKRQRSHRKPGAPVCDGFTYL